MTRKQKRIEESLKIFEETAKKENLFPKGCWKDKDKMEKSFARLLDVAPPLMSIREEQLYNHGWQCLKDYRNKKIDYGELLATKIKVKKGYNSRGEKLDGKTFRFTELTWPSGNSGIGGRIDLLRKLEI
jgi:hypothetical protein|tara:strand:- start:179 stop:565 length:387 start_codon:yes stop_codon:yes gene_type:complete